MSKLLLQILIIEYVIIMIACMFECRWVMVLYWSGAVALNLAVLHISYFGN